MSNHLPADALELLNRMRILSRHGDSDAALGASANSSDTSLQQPLPPAIETALGSLCNGDSQMDGPAMLSRFMRHDRLFLTLPNGCLMQLNGAPASQLNDFYRHVVPPHVRQPSSAPHPRGGRKRVALSDPEPVTRSKAIKPASNSNDPADVASSQPAATEAAVLRAVPCASAAMPATATAAAAGAVDGACSQRKRPRLSSWRRRKSRKAEREAAADPVGGVSASPIPCAPPISEPDNPSGGDRTPACIRIDHQTCERASQAGAHPHVDSLANLGYPAPPSPPVSPTALSWAQSPPSHSPRVTDAGCESTPQAPAASCCMRFCTNGSAQCTGRCSSQCKSQHVPTRRALRVFMRRVMHRHCRTSYHALLRRHMPALAVDPSGRLCNGGGVQWHHVRRLAWAVSACVIPRRMVGGSRNFSLLVRNLCRHVLVDGLRHKQIKLPMRVVHQLRTGGGSGGRQAALARQRRLAQLCNWLAVRLLLPVLRRMLTSRATSRHADAAQCDPWPRGYWATASRLHTRKVKRTSLERLDVVQASALLSQEGRQIGCAPFSLVPKGGGDFRNIYNLNRAARLPKAVRAASTAACDAAQAHVTHRASGVGSAHGGNGDCRNSRRGGSEGDLPRSSTSQPINNVLSHLLPILASLRHTLPAASASSILGLSEAHARWRAFVARRRRDAPDELLVFNSTDYKGCFDTLDQSRLMHSIATAMRLLLCTRPITAPAAPAVPQSAAPQACATAYSRQSQHPLPPSVILTRQFKLIRPAGQRFTMRTVTDVAGAASGAADLVCIASRLAGSGVARDALIVPKESATGLSAAAALALLREHIFRSDMHVGLARRLCRCPVVAGAPVLDQFGLPPPAPLASHET